MRTQRQHQCESASASRRPVVQFKQFQSCTAPILGERRVFMRIEQVYSHLNGKEWILVHERPIWAEIRDVIQRIDANKYRTKVSKEARKLGQNLYAPTRLNARFKKEFKKLGWDEIRTVNWLTEDVKLVRQTVALPADEQREIIEGAGAEPIYSFNQTDFQKSRVAIEVQFGKYSFISYDLFVKHMAFYVGDKIDVGVEILPMKSMQTGMSSGPGYYEKAIYDVVRQGRGVPAVPLVIVGVVP